MRLSVREILMLVTIVALFLPYVLPESKPKKQLPSLLQFSAKDFAAWFGTNFKQSFDITIEQSVQTGTTVDSLSGDFEATAPANTSGTMFNLWKTNIDSKIVSEQWRILDSWSGDDWFEYELQKGETIRRLFCANRPSSSKPPREIRNGYEQVRFVWVNSGFRTSDTPMEASK